MKSSQEIINQINQLSYTSLSKLILQLIFVLLVILVGAKYFLLDFEIVSSNSMAPLLEKGDYIIVSKVAYSCFGIPVKSVATDDLVAVNFKDKKLVKRIAGIGGDTIYYDDSNCFNSQHFEIRANHLFKVKIIPEDEVFLVGDNIRNSNDSRDFGTVSIQQIIGKPIVIYYSSNKKGFKFIK